MEIIIALLLADVLIVALVCRYYVASQKRYFADVQQKARDRLLYIQLLMEQVYLYKHAPEALLEHLSHQMSIQQLLRSHVIDDNCDELIPLELKIQHNDKLLYKLHEEGFTVPQLCVIFELNNMNSVYVKFHRVKRKLNQEKEEDKTLRHATES